MPTTQFSRSLHLDPAEAAGIRRHGVVAMPLKTPIIAVDERAGLAQVEAAGQAVGVVAQVDLDPAGLAVDRDRDLDGMPSGTPGNGSWRRATTCRPLGSRRIASTIRASE